MRTNIYTIYRLLFTLCYVLFFYTAMAQGQFDQHRKNENNNTKTSQIDSINKAAFNVFRSDPYKTIEIANIALKLSQEIDYTTGAGKANNYIGIAYHIMNNYDSAMVYYRQSLDIFEKNNDLKNAARIYNNLALLYSNQKYYNLALEQYLKSLKVSNDQLDTQNVMNAYNNIGIVYEQLEQYDKAIFYYNKALNFSENAEQYSSPFNNILGNLGIIYLYLNHFDTAKIYLSNSLLRFQKENDLYGQANTYSYMSKLYLKTGKTDSAFIELNLSDSFAKKINDDELLITNNYYRAQLYQNLHQYAKAESIASQVIFESGSKNLSKISSDGYMLLYEIALAKENFKEAINFFKQATSFKDSMRSNEFKSREAELTIQYDLFQKENEIIQLKRNKELQEISLLRKATQNRMLIILLLALLLLLTITLWMVRKVRIKNKLLSINKEELEKRVKERTADLEIALGKAEESDRLKSAFLSNMSHEIRTPLNSILGFTEIMDQQIDAVSFDRYKAIIDKSGHHLLALINDILDISKIQANQLTLSPVQFNPGELLIAYKDKASVLKREFGKDHLKLNLILPNGWENIMIFADETRFNQILNNLFSNAIKNTTSGFIHFGFRPIDQDNRNWLEFFVEDTGEGITAENLVSIFDRFVQASTTRVNDGAGLGLAITKGLVELMGGTIWVRSEVGIGSTFSFKLPDSVK